MPEQTNLNVAPFFADFKTDINECECEQDPIPEVVLDID